MPQKEA